MTPTESELSTVTLSPSRARRSAGPFLSGYPSTAGLQRVRCRPATGHVFEGARVTEIHCSPIRTDSLFAEAS